MTFSNLCNDIFWKSTTDYHVTDSVDAPMNNPYELKSIEYYLYLKNWIDAVQWHFEDIIRDPHIDPVAAVALKRRIDKSNQDRTDLVELIDSYFLDRYKDVKPLADATINTESPAWAVDRLLYSCFENLPHAARSGTYGYDGRTSCTMPGETGYSAGTTERPFFGYRSAAG